MAGDQQSISVQGIILLIMNIYFDSSIPLWQQFYKDGQIEGVDGQEGCEALHTYMDSIGSRCFHPSDADASPPMFMSSCPDEYAPWNRLCACTSTLTCDGYTGQPTWCNRKENRCDSQPCAELCSEVGSVAHGKEAMCEMEDCKGCSECLAAPPETTANLTVRFLMTDEQPTKPKVVNDTMRLQEGKDCSYYCVRDAAGLKDVNGKNIYWRKPQSYSKGAALFVQATTGSLLFYCVNLYLGGRERLLQCFNVQKLLRFAPIGMCFGMAAVFSFFAQTSLSPGSYALYAQSGVVIIPILWRLAFCKPLAAITWMHIMIIACGIMIYFLPSKLSEGADEHEAEGLAWVAAKVLGSALGTIGAELFLKGGDPPPLTVSMSYILPWKALGCLITCPILEKDFWVWYNFRRNGILHDWNFKLILIVGHNLGDTCMSGVIAFYFDSIVKAICGVVGIICPTWLVSFLLGWEHINIRTLSGCVQIAGGVVVVTGAFAYALGRAVTSEMEELTLKLANAEKPPTLAKRFSVMRTQAQARVRRTVIPILDSANMMEAEYTQKETEIENKRASIRASLHASARREVELRDRA